LSVLRKIARDITAQKRAEKLLRRQADLLDLSHDAIFTQRRGGDRNRPGEVRAERPEAAPLGGSVGSDTYAAWELFEKEDGRWGLVDWADLDGATLNEAKAVAEAGLAKSQPARCVRYII
jgi:hypothetical protein